MNSTVALDKTELLLWNILSNFESLALKQYELYDLALATAEKRALIDLLAGNVHCDEVLEATTLSAPLGDLLASAKGSDDTHTLIAQGLLLETLGRTIYLSLATNDSIGPDTRALCATGLKASDANVSILPGLLTAKFPVAEDFAQAFNTITRPVIFRLDALGQCLDQYFAERFGLYYADLIGEFVAELVPLCVELGMDRRKVITGLTDSLMRSS